jgi:hypothetical protein
MCPVCVATAVLIAGGVASAGGLAAAASKKLSRRPAPRNVDDRGEAGSPPDVTSGGADDGHAGDHPLGLLDG